LVYFSQHDVASGGNVREFAGGAGYNFASARVFGLVTDVQLSSGDSPRATTYEIGATDSITPAFQIGGGFQYQTRNNDIASAGQITLSADYFLSKRTDVYAIVAVARDRGYGAQVEAALGANATESMQTAVRVGLRHTF
jgi:predicted porin